MTKYMVTGSSGFIGGNLTLHLRKEPDVEQVVLLDKDPWSPHKIAGNERRLISDMSSISVGCLASAYPVDVVIHLSAIATIPNSFKIPQEMVRANVEGTAGALEYARLCGAKVVYASTSSAYGSTDANPYTFTKKIGEELCEAYRKWYPEFKVDICRFFNVYGPGHRRNMMSFFERQKREGKPLTVTGDGSQTRDFTHVDDICKALILLAKTDTGKGDLWAAGTERPYTVQAVARMFKPSKIEYIPRPAGEVQDSLADSHKLREIGWAPEDRLPGHIEQFLLTLEADDETGTRLGK